MVRNFGLDPDHVLDVWPDYKIDSRELERFRRIRNACLVGGATMRKFGWQIGQEITLRGTIFPVNLTLRIVGTIPENAGNPLVLWFNREYLEEAMSFNLRFGRNKYGRFLCVENFHRDYYVQNVCALLGDTVFAETGFAAGIEAITALYQKPAVDLPSKILEMRQLFRELCQQFCPDARVDPVDPQSEAGHLREILRDVSGRMPYLSPAAVKQMRPQGPIAPAQRALINEKAGDAGHSGGR